MADCRLQVEMQAGAGDLSRFSPRQEHLNITCVPSKQIIRAGNPAEARERQTWARLKPSPGKDYCGRPN